MRILIVGILLISTQLSFGQSKEISLQNGILTFNVEGKHSLKKTGWDYNLQFGYGPESLGIVCQGAESNILDQAFQIQFLDVVPDVFPSYKTFIRKDTLINDQKYKWEVYTVTDRGVKFKNLYCSTLYEGHYYSFIFYSLSSKFDRFYPIFSKLMSTVKFNQPAFVGDETLNQILNKRYKVKAAMIDGFPQTDQELLRHSIVISDKGRITYYHRSGNVLFTSIFTYDSENKTIEYLRDGRLESFKIELMDSSKISFKGKDYMKSVASRVYEILE